MNNTRRLTVGCGGSHRGRPIPGIRLSGFWLRSFGFDAGMQIVAEYDFCSITLIRKNQYTEAYFYPAARAFREGNRGIMPVQNMVGGDKPKPQIAIKGRWLETLGFSVGDRLIVHCEQGVIRIQKADFQREVTV